MNNARNQLKQIVDKFQVARNVQQKQDLNDILLRIRTEGYTTSQVYASLGEDSAAIRPDPTQDQLILLTTDAILPEFIEQSPWGAGFSSVYVGIEDLIACGGIPLACSITVGYNSIELGQEIFRGVIDATQRFHIPLIRGHTRTDAPVNSLTSALIGSTDIDHFASIQKVMIGDFVALIFDPDGLPAKANRLYWDTITNKDYDSFYQKRAFLRPLIEENKIHACKDISNGGILGTIYQLSQYCGKGSNVNLTPFINLEPFISLGYAFDEILSLFLTSAFIITGPIESIQEVEIKIRECQMEFLEIGSIIKAKKVITQLSKEKMDLFTLK